LCFSATASFVTAGLTAAAGVLCLARASSPRELPLAAMPLLFAAQQAAEGFLWLSMPAQGGAVPALTLAFLLFARVIWPVYAPASAWLVEPAPWRRRMMALFLALGVAVGGYLLLGLTSGPVQARIADGHIAYTTVQPYSDLLATAYFAATALPLLLSSRRAVAVLGLIVLAGSLTALAFYRGSFQSVWCYFAAAGSLVLLAHFQGARRRRAATA
jgi:hypothetical protein